MNIFEILWKMSVKTFLVLWCHEILNILKILFHYEFLIVGLERFKSVPWIIRNHMHYITSKIYME